MGKIFKRVGLAPLFILFFSLPLWAQTETEFIDGDEVVAHDVLVKFQVPAHEALPQVVRDEDIDEVHGVGGIDVHLLHSRSKNTATLIRNLSRNPHVEYVEPNYIIEAIAVPNDSSFGQLWGLNNTGQSILGVVGISGADIDAVPAWDLTVGSADNVVTVVDTGIDYNHPDLAANIWSAPAPFTVVIGGVTINCDAGTHGFNALNNTCNPMDDNNHGTHCSGTIGAVGDNGIGVAGVNWTASIMGSKFLSSSGSGSTVGAINAIEFAVQAKQAFAATGDANVRVLSNSWGGGGFSQALLDQINRANNNDMLFVAAAGNANSNNDVSPFYPASYNAPNLIAVAATDNKDSRASFSNYGANSVDLGAPGVSILSTIRSGSYAYYNGTSMATPHVSGAASLVLSLCDLDTAGLISTILDNVDPIASMSSTTISGGRLNVNNALSACAGVPPSPDFSLSATPASQTVIAGNSANYTVTLASSGGYSDTVSFNATGLPAGASASFSPSSVSTSGSSTMTVATTTSITPGTYTVVINGTDGSLTHTTSVLLTITAPVVPNFSIFASPSSRSITRGTSTSYTVTLTPLEGFTGTVTFSATGLPANSSASFVPSTLTTSGTTKMTVVTSSSTVKGSYKLTIKGVSGGTTRTTLVSLKVR